MTVRYQSLAVLIVAAGLHGCGQQQLPPAAAAATPVAGNTYTAPRAAPALRSVSLTVPDGTELHIILSSAIGSATSMLGDKVVGTTTSAVLVGDRVAIPAGSTIQGRVTAVDPATKGLKISEKGGSLELAFTKVTTPVGDSATMSSSLTSLASSNGKTAAIIGGSTAGGAILGKIIGGHTKDAAIGAVVGGGIGTGIAAGTKGKEVVLPAGSALAIILDRPLTIAQRS
jgi:hypothetical protein